MLSARLVFTKEIERFFSIKINRKTLLFSFSQKVSITRSYGIDYKLWGKFITKNYEKYVQFL